MLSTEFRSSLQRLLEEIKEGGLYKSEKLISSSQDVMIRLDDGREVLNMCANNYLGLASHPTVVELSLIHISEPTRLLSIS